MPSAHELLAARARRVTAIRRRIVAAVLASFVLAWGAVMWDGSMGATTTAQATSSSTATETTTTDEWPTETETEEPATSSDDDDGSSLSTSQS